MKRKWFLFACMLITLLTACASPAAPAVSTTGLEAPWPTRDWTVSTPVEQGMKPELLEKMQSEIAASKINLHSLLIIRNGYIVSETYYHGWKANQPHELYSVTKSFVSSLAGIASDQGKLGSVNQQVLDLLPERTFAQVDQRKQAMTVEDLLTMSSGLDWVEGDPAYRAMYMSRDWVKAVLDLPMIAEPGEEFNYCSGCSHVLAAVITEQVDMDLNNYASQYLFEPMGIQNPRWDRDAENMPIGGWGLNLTPRQMAKLGYLYLHHGTWDGSQLLSSAWIQNATSKHQDGEGRLDYGYQWWIDRKDGAYAALGRAGQMIYVDPTYNLVVVTTADLPGNHDPLLDLIDEYILPAAR